MDQNNGLSNDDKNIIAHNEESMNEIVRQLEKVRQFKVNDYLICSRIFADTGQKVPITNSYGTRTKYKVLAVDKNGIPYVKEISSKGKTRGPIKPLMGVNEYNDWGDVMNPDDFEFEHDPVFVESMILQAEDSYDPTEIQRNKKAARDEITKHNLEAKVKSELPELIAAFATMSAGQTWWFSIKNGMHIDKVTIVSPPIGWGSVYRRNKSLVQIDVTLSTGKKATYLPHDFRNRNLYSKQPRSYKELSDTI